MTSLNIVSTSNTKEQIEQIKKERDLRISLIEEQFPMIDQKFESIFGRAWRKVLDLAKNNRKDKIRMIQNEAANKIDEILVAEKAAKMADLDQYINEICA